MLRRALVAATLAAGLSAAYGQSHVGTWVMSVQGRQVVLSLKPDGTFDLAGNAGTYRVMGNVMETTSPGGTFRYQMQIQGDTMVLSGGDLQAPLTLTRLRTPTRQPQTSAPGPSAAPAAGRVPAFELRQAGNARFGYPKGWQVQTIQGGYFITENGPNTIGPGIMLMGGPAPANMTTVQAVASNMLQALKRTTPSLQVVAQGMHPQFPRIMRARLAYSQGATAYDATCYADLAQGQFVFAMFFAPRSRAAQFSAEAMLLSTIGPMYGMTQQQIAASISALPNSPSSAPVAGAPATGAPAQPGQSGAQAARITDNWFLPAGKTLRGFYGGMIFRDTLRSHTTTAVAPAEGVAHVQSSGAQTGGDFRVALYTDGSIRAKLVVANWGPMVSYNVPLRYTVTYQLAADGAFRTSEMACTADRPTYRKFEQLMAKMRMSGRYVQQSDSLQVHVETWNMQQNRWWSKGQKVLGPAQQRKTYVFGQTNTPGVGQVQSGGMR